MQSRIDTLALIETALWQELQLAAAQPGHDWRTMALATIEGDSAQARTVMLREVDVASLPIVTPCSLLPISAPHIQNGRLSSTACVARACGMVIQVQRTFSPAGYWRRGRQSSSCASFGSRSLFLANRTRST